jgi:hypothetical protein
MHLIIEAFMLTVSTLNRILANVPDYKVFHTVAEMDENSRKLASENPGLVSLFEIGKTSKGYPLYCLKIGSGSRNALLMGCPHPNEPIGAMLLEYFSQALVEDQALREELDYTWYIIKSWDADGTMLNEGWFKGPFTLYHYARNFYRPPGTQMVDYTFPVDYKKFHFRETIPETAAVMRLIEEIRPVFNYSLHNAGFGGVYFYISRPAEEIYDALRGAAGRQHVPLHLGEPESPYGHAFSPAVYQLMGIAEEYDYYEKYGVENPELLVPTGAGSSEFAGELCNTFTLLTELPYFYDKRIDDLSPSELTRRDAVLANLDASDEADKVIVGIMDGVRDWVSSENPFLLALDAFLSYAAGNGSMRKMVKEKPEYAEIATVAEKFDNLLISKFYKMLSFGLLVRAHEYELQKLQRTGTMDAQIQAAFRHAMNISEIELNQRCAYLEERIDYQVIPIQKLIRIQLESGLVTADYLGRAV